MSKKDASSTMFPPPQAQPPPSPASSHANGYGRGSHGRALAAGHHAVAQVLEEAEELHGTRRCGTVTQSSVDSRAHSLTKSPAKSHLPFSPRS